MIDVQRICCSNEVLKGDPNLARPTIQDLSNYYPSLFDTSVRLVSETSVVSAISTSTRTK